jgi:hypothetical protein
MDLFSYVSMGKGALFSAAMRDISAPVIAASVAVIALRMWMWRWM